MSSAPENWYVYYPTPRVPAVALAALRAMQAELMQRSGVRAHLEERVASGSTPTWMEVYEGIRDPDSFAAELRAGVDSSGLATHAVERRIERFRHL